jgi:hypothetical protein
MSISEKLSLIAKKSNQRAKYAAIIIHRNKVIGVGYNHINSYSTQTNQCLL